MTHETKWCIYEHAQRLLAELRAGKRLDPHAKAWAEWNVRINAPQPKEPPCAS